MQTPDSSKIALGPGAVCLSGVPTLVTSSKLLEFEDKRSWGCVAQRARIMEKTVSKMKWPMEYLLYEPE